MWSIWIRLIYRILIVSFYFVSAMSASQRKLVITWFLELIRFEHVNDFCRWEITLILSFTCSIRIGFREEVFTSKKATCAAEFIMKRVPSCKVTPHYCSIESKDEDFYRVGFNIFQITWFTERILTKHFNEKCRINSYFLYSCFIKILIKNCRSLKWSV